MKRQVYKKTMEKGYLLTLEHRNPIPHWIPKELFVRAGLSLEEIARRADLSLKELQIMSKTGNPNWLQQREAHSLERVKAVLATIQSDLTTQAQALSSAQRIRAMAVAVEVKECERYYELWGDFYARDSEGHILVDKIGRKMLIRLPDELLKNVPFQPYLAAILDTRKALQQDAILLEAEREAALSESGDNAHTIDMVKQILPSKRD
jgi:hypothetical protein